MENRNPYEGIEFFPAVGKYGVVVSHRVPKQKKILATFDTLQEALMARKGLLERAVQHRDHMELRELLA